MHQCTGLSLVLPPIHFKSFYHFISKRCAFQLLYYDQHTFRKADHVIELPCVDCILPKGPYPPCLRMADRALLAGYPRCLFSVANDVSSWQTETKSGGRCSEHKSHSALLPGTPAHLLVAGENNTRTGQDRVTFNTLISIRHFGDSKTMLVSSFWFHWCFLKWVLLTTFSIG